LQNNRLTMSKSKYSAGRGYDYNKPATRRGHHQEGRRRVLGNLLMLVIGLSIIAVLVYLSITK